MIQRLGRRFLLEIADFSVFHPRTVLIGALAAGILAAWAVAGLARAGALLQEPAWLSMAERCAGFLLETMRDASGRTLRVFHGERATGMGFLEDVAGLLDACLALYSAGGDERWRRLLVAIDAYRRVVFRQLAIERWLEHWRAREAAPR